MTLLTDFFASSRRLLPFVFWCIAMILITVCYRGPTTLGTTLMAALAEGQTWGLRIWNPKRTTLTPYLANPRNQTHRMSFRIICKGFAAGALIISNCGTHLASMMAALALIFA